MESPQANNIVCVVQHMHDIPEYITCVANLAQNSRSYKMIELPLKRKPELYASILMVLPLQKMVTNPLKMSVSGHAPTHFNQQNLTAAIQSDAVIACKH
jgi:hypothetical protein